MKGVIVWLWNRLINALSIVSIMLLGVFAFFGFMYFTDTNINPLEFLGNTMQLTTYKMQAISHLNDNVSVNISNYCEGFPPKEQVECVVYQVMPFYNYTLHNDTIRSPDQYVLEGGVCRDIAVLYHTIFSRLGWYIQYDFSVPHHVFLTVIKYNNNQTVRCLVDSLTYNCEIYN